MYDSEGRFIPAKFEEIFTKYVFVAFAASCSSVADEFRWNDRFDKGNKGGLTFREGVHVSYFLRMNEQAGWDRPHTLSGPIFVSAYALGSPRSNSINSHGYRSTLPLADYPRSAPGC